jgi:hypothetical protein
LRPALQLVRCRHCGGPHSESAHEDPAVALRIAYDTARSGDATGAAFWIAVVMKLRKDGRK